MDLLTAESAIKSRLEEQITANLQSNLAAPRIESFPQDPQQHFESINPNGEILVRFNNAVPTIPDPNNQSVIVQDIPIDWSIWIIMPNLITHTGIYNWINRVKNALTGWAVPEWPDSTPLYCNNIQFIDEEGGFWYYEMTFQHILEESEV